MTAPPVPYHRLVVGHSVEHRAIVARVVGPLDAPRRVLVVGCTHGTERAGRAITGALRHAAPPPRTALWLVDDINPDGCLQHTRTNAHGVDLNRNLPWQWRPLPRGLFYSGPRPLSEPESRAAVRLVRRVRPAVSIYYHQHAALVDADSGGSPRIERRYARLAGLPFRHYGRLPGTLTGWQNHAFPRATAFVVELPSRLGRRGAARNVRAVLSVSRRYR